MRNAPAMPELQEDAAAGVVYRLRDEPPASHLFPRPNAGRVGVAHGIEPLAREMFGRGLAGEEAVDGAFVGIGGGVALKFRDFLRGWVATR